MSKNKINYTSNYMISFEDARKLIQQNSVALISEYIALKKSLNRILAEDIISPISVPTFNNSAMDGYAVKSSEVLNASKNNPVTLEILGTTAAGDNIAIVDDIQNSAWKIMTGAPVPIVYDSIIPIEKTKLEDSKNNQNVSCFESTSTGAHIRESGEDFTQGDIVLNEGIKLNANRIMALASLGVNKVLVKRLPKISVFSTGKELVDDLSLELRPGQIYNSNMPYILEYLKSLPVSVKNAGTNLDDAELYRSKLQEELDSGAQVIISTGAVSMGDFDFIPQTILKMGGEIIFHKVRIKPGKPILFAKFKNGAVYIGLPGNPISTTVGLRFFVTHLILIMLGCSSEKPKRAILKNTVNKNRTLMAILKASVSVSDDATMESIIMQGQESFKINPLVDANAWVVLDEELESAEEGMLVDYYLSDISI